MRLATEKYQQLILKHFIAPKEPITQHPRFSDIKREKSFGKIIDEINSRKSSGEKDQK